MNNKKNYKPLIIGIILQLLVYYGSYTSLNDWGLVFKTSFQSIPYAIGNNLPIIIGLIITIIKNKKTV